MDKDIFSEKLPYAADLAAQEERFMEHYGVPSVLLMERAALSVYAEIPEKTKRILFLCGRGKNGADGLAAARILREQGRSADIFLLPSGRETPEFLYQKKLLSEFPEGRIYRDFEGVQEVIGFYDCIVDAVFGIGFNRKMDSGLLELFQTANETNALRISVDIPSGVLSDTGAVFDTAFKADITVTFSYGKPGLFLYPGRSFAGAVKLRKIGIPDRIAPENVPFVTGTPGALPVFPKRPDDAHKGTFGRIAVFAGSAGMPGAAVLSTKACYRAGGGVVKLFSESSVLKVVNEIMPEVITEEIRPETLSEEMLKGFRAFAVGPGLGKSEEAMKIVKLLLKVPIPSVWDADAINILSEMLPGREPEEETAHFLKRRLAALAGLMGTEAVMTPHPKELSGLLGIGLSELRENAKEFLPLFKELPFVLVMKDAATVVAGKGRAYLNQTGNSGMATGGSGDVLTGILGAFLSIFEPFTAAERAVYLHGLCGDRAKERLSGTSMTAGDLIASLCILSGEEEKSET